MSALTIIIILIVVVVIVAIGYYNKFVRLKNRADEGWADIDVQLKRRYDLIPNLVETVKGYAKHESGVFEAVTEARSKANQMKIDPANASAEQLQQFAGMQDGLSGALSKLFALAENYPDLKANQNFLELQKELSDTENKIQAARRFYNGVVRDMNTAVEMFPGNIIAGMFNFGKREFFEIEEGSEEKEPVKVAF